MLSLILVFFTGYVLGLIMMVIIIAIGAGIVLGYIYKRSVAVLLCSSCCGVDPISVLFWPISSCKP